MSSDVKWSEKSISGIFKSLKWHLMGHMSIFWGSGEGFFWDRWWKVPFFFNRDRLMICWTLDLNSSYNFDIEALRISFRRLQQTYANVRRLVRTELNWRTFGVRFVDRVVRMFDHTNESKQHEYEYGSYIASLRRTDGRRIFAAVPTRARDDWSSS